MYRRDTNKRNVPQPSLYYIRANVQVRYCIVRFDYCILTFLTTAVELTLNISNKPPFLRSKGGVGR